MRVITGKARGKRLETLAGDEVVRPTAERVKEGLFSAIQFYIAGAKVLDLFAGSGQLGIEALSRGAAVCTFIDQNRDAAAVVRRNLNNAGLSAQARVILSDSFRFLQESPDSFDIVFVDPPYNKGLAKDALDRLDRLVNEGGFVLCETEMGGGLPESAGDLRLHRTYKYGKTIIWLYKKQAG